MTSTRTDVAMVIPRPLGSSRSVLVIAAALMTSWAKLLEVTPLLMHVMLVSWLSWLQTLLVLGVMLVAVAVVAVVVVAVVLVLVAVLVLVGEEVVVVAVAVAVAVVVVAVVLVGVAVLVLVGEEVVVVVAVSEEVVVVVVVVVSEHVVGVAHDVQRALVLQVGAPRGPAAGGPAAGGARPLVVVVGAVGPADGRPPAALSQSLRAVLAERQHAGLQRHLLRNEEQVRQGTAVISIIMMITVDVIIVVTIIILLFVFNF